MIVTIRHSWPLKMMDAWKSTFKSFFQFGVQMLITNLFCLTMQCSNTLSKYASKVERGAENHHKLLKSISKNVDRKKLITKAFCKVIILVIMLHKSPTTCKSYHWKYAIFAIISLIAIKKILWFVLSAWGSMVVSSRSIKRFMSKPAILEFLWLIKTRRNWN